MNNSGVLGCHISNGPIDLPDLNRMLAMGLQHYTLLHYQSEYLPTLRSSASGLLLVRYYDTNLLPKSPANYAQAVADEYKYWSLYTHHVVFANELNLQEEGGNGYDDPAAVASWVVTVAQVLRRLAPDIVMHCPALSPNGNWLTYLAHLAVWHKLFDVIDLHVYGTLDSMKQQYDSATKLFPSSTRFFVSEFNGPGAWDFMKWIQGDPRCIAATYFSWHWHNPPDWWSLDLRGSYLEQQLLKLKENTMALEDEFPNEYAAWVAAGGITANLRKHLIGIGSIVPSPSDLRFLADECKASAEQLRNALANYPF